MNTPLRPQIDPALPRWQTGEMSPSERSADNLVWIDLEMTGLDPAKEVILQAALVITTADLTVLDEVAFDVWQPEEPLRQMIPVVREMHERTA